jgi:hypothetical protein
MSQIQEFQASTLFLEELQNLKDFTVPELLEAGAWFKRACAKRGTPNKATIKHAAKKYAER